MVAVIMINKALSHVAWNLGDTLGRSSIALLCETIHMETEYIENKLSNRLLRFRGNTRSSTFSHENIYLMA